MKFSKKILGLSLVLSFLITFPEVQAQSILDKLRSNNQTTQFAQALKNAGINERLNQSGPFTVFAPTNAAFDELSMGQKSDSNLLLNHILTGMATERSLRAMSDITCLSGQTISIQNKSGNNLAIESNKISVSNIKASNGVIHIIEGVID
ncbi:fasciclin domain-containing protein [Fodinibius sp.]|uniref:fasciclin domain-containing protein n=1 Tax=Fodinibius sp. TaxID=1872440 RepID=UPI002ACEC83C|nr:fasciclin domain-containing protein [Fodinibius sp.]MDZ7660216.1 fasciclin domain-containing protein [Fodinibius sp.]